MVKKIRNCLSGPENQQADSNNVEYTKCEEEERQRSPTQNQARYLSHSSLETGNEYSVVEKSDALPTKLKKGENLDVSQQGKR